MAEHNHVDYSNNMWRWKFVDNVVEANSNGGLVMELPLILNPYINGNHSVEINGSTFRDNSMFEFNVAGGFANLTMYNNLFQNNVAKKGKAVLSMSDRCQAATGSCNVACI